MAGKQQSNLVAPPKTTAVLLLEFGRLLYCQRRQADHDPAQIEKAEEQLVAQVSSEKNSSLKLALNINISNPVDPVMLRIFAIVSYIQLCTDNSAAAVSTAVKLCVGEEPAAVLAARKTISQLLLTKRLLIRPETNGCVELGRAMIEFLSGGTSEPPILLSEEDLRYRIQKAGAQAVKRRPVVAPDFSTLPSAKKLADDIHQCVIGVDEQVKTIASRLALHMRRAALIRSDQDPGCGNECLLFVGPSGCGKTFLAEVAGRSSGLPFSSVSAGDLTSEGYVGLSCTDTIRPLITAAGGDMQKARFGLAFVDCWDKKASVETHWRDIGGTVVQQEMLRLMEGTEVQLGGRRSGDYSSSGNFNTRGTCFIFAGAFIGLELTTKESGAGIGFGPCSTGSRRKASLYEALEKYGLIPEFLNRLTAVMVFPEPTIEQLLQIAIHSILPAHNRLLATYKAEVVIRHDALDLIVVTALETGTYARGIKSVVAKLTEKIAYDGKPGSFVADTALVRRAIEGVGLG